MYSLKAVAGRKGQIITPLNLGTKIKAAVEDRSCRWRRSLWGPSFFIRSLQSC